VTVALSSAAHAMNHPYSSEEEAALSAFRARDVDLTREDTGFGRALRDVVIQQCEGLSGRESFPPLLSGRSFGAGSFARRTLCRPLDDIDVYLVLDACGAPMSDDRQTYRLEGSAAGPLASDPSLEVDGWISSHLVLGRLVSGLWAPPVVAEQRGTVGMSDKGKSAFLSFPRWQVKVDVTPVLWATNFVNSIDRYYMPQGRGSIWWKATNPKEDQRRLSEQNQLQGGLLLPTIRMLKWWNANRNGGRLKGIHLEVLAERGLSLHYLEGVAQALHMAFVAMQTQLERPCPDPTGLGPPLDCNLSQVDRTESTRAAQRAHLATIGAADRFRAGDVPGGLANWREVFPGL